METKHQLMHELLTVGSWENDKTINNLQLGYK